MVRQLRAAILALALVVPAGHVVMAQDDAELLVAQSSDSQPAANVEESCLTPPFSPEDQAAVDQQARDIAWILAGGRPVDPVLDGGGSERLDEVPPRVLKWPEGTAIKVAYTYARTWGDVKRNPKRREWRVGRAPTGAHVKALVGRLRQATGLALDLGKGWHPRPDNTINIRVLDDYVLDEWDPSGRDGERHRKYQYIVAGKFIGDVGCWVRIFHDDAYRIKYAHLTPWFDRYADAEVSRCLAEGAAWALGVPLWAPEDDKSEALGPFTLIEALYDPRIEPGMTEAQVYPIVRDRLCAQR